MGFPLSVSELLQRLSRNSIVEYVVYEATCHYQHCYVSSYHHPVRQNVRIFNNRFAWLARVYLIAKVKKELENAEDRPE